MTTLLASAQVRAAHLNEVTEHHSPTDEHRTDRWLTQPITNEPRFTYRLGMLLSATCFGLPQAGAARAAMVALLASVRRDSPHGAKVLTDAQRSMLLDQPLWMVLPRPGCGYSPDIILVDAEGRVVLVIEAKGPNAKRQCTPARSLAKTQRWEESAQGRKFRDLVLATRPSEMNSHPDEGCEECWMTNRGRQRGEHVAAFHQCDAYRYGWDWLPERFTVHPKAVWLLLVPQRTPSVRFFDGAASAPDWVVADIEAFHVALREQSRAAMTEWETGRLDDLTTGIAGLYLDA